MNQIKKLLYLGLLMAGTHFSFCQQTPVFAEYNANPFLINPAYSGSFNGTEAVLSNSGFGSEIQNTPKNLSFSFTAPLQQGKMGLGAAVISDEIGVTKATQGFAAFSYKLFFDWKKNRPYWQVFERTVLSFGVTAGVLSYNEDLLSLQIQNDANFSENINETLPMAGLGFLFGHENFFAGISAPNILGDTFANSQNLNLTRPIYGYLGYHFITNKYDPTYIMKPSVLLKHEAGAPFQVDANISVSYKNVIEVGAGFRSSSSLNLFAGLYAFKNFRVLYNYSSANANSPLGNFHGIVLNYRGGRGFAFD
ncbi:PorP/SprF family type IX secretion system membrane protein [Croceivirga radicis]|uniref:PorP/SprF family type IX secretion system membrane protein n=1 Tax=Croceivirga radicis TaxID=1929488 RepID=UPI000255B1EA|nr:PorP/SprF family type IX secretion system membrane protein [Croceivirga radicis]